LSNTGVKKGKQHQTAKGPHQGSGQVFPAEPGNQGRIGPGPARKTEKIMGVYYFCSGEWSEDYVFLLSLLRADVAGLFTGTDRNLTHQQTEQEQIVQCR
jgi:hypothetical protein